MAFEEVMVGALWPVIHEAEVEQSTGRQAGRPSSWDWLAGEAESPGVVSAQQHASPPLQEAQVQTVTQEASWANRGANRSAGRAGIATRAYQATMRAENQVERNTPRTD